MTIPLPIRGGPPTPRRPEAPYWQMADSRQTPPPGDECETLKWLLKREQDVVQAMQAWDAKWLPGRQAEAIRQRMRGIDKLKKKKIEERREKCD